MSEKILQISRKIKSWTSRYNRRRYYKMWRYGYAWRCNL